MKCRKTKAVVRYHTPKKTKELEKYFHNLLMLHYPWKNEDTLLGQGRPGGGGGGGGSGIPIYPKKNRQNTPKYPKFLQIYPKVIEALNTLYQKLDVSETNTYLVVLLFLAFLQMDCHYFPTITDHKKRPHVYLNGKIVCYG